jgi:hypothetical protein
MNRFENPGAVLAAAWAAWAAAVAVGAAMDVFARISPEAAAALAILAMVFPPAVLALDESVRRHVAALPARSVALPFGVVSVAVLSLVALLLRRHGLAWGAAVSGPFALLTYFLLPLWVGLAAESARRTLSLRRSAPATSPAARRDAPRAARTSARGAGAAGA